MASQTSPLEDLPPEVFNRILYFLLHHKAVERRATFSNPRRYVFETSVLRLNKDIHHLAQSYFHVDNHWTKIHTNLTNFVRGLNAIGIPFYQIPEILEVNPESIFPEATLEASIISPLLAGSEDEVWEQEDKGRRKVYTYMVLPSDLKDFVICLHIYDLIHCAHFGRKVRSWKVVRTSKTDQAAGAMDNLCLSIGTQPEASMENRTVSPAVFSILKGPSSRQRLANNRGTAPPTSISQKTTTARKTAMFILLSGLEYTNWLLNRAHALYPISQYTLANSTLCESSNLISAILTHTRKSGSSLPQSTIRWFKSIATSMTAAHTFNTYLFRTKMLMKYPDQTHHPVNTWCKIDRYYQPRLDQIYNRQGDLTDFDEDFVLFFETVVRCDRIVQRMGDRQYNVGVVVDMRARLPVGVNWKAPLLYWLLERVDERSGPFDESKYERVVRDVGVWLQWVRPWRWTVHEDDVPVGGLKDCLRVVDKGVEDKYTLFEVPWGVPGRPGKRYLL
jgi:hypothetical protein